MSDPYASPKAFALRRPTQTAGDVLKAWVKLAALYNVVLVLVTGFTATILAGPMFMVDAAGDLILYAMAANMCFLAGPAMELGYRLLGGRSTVLRTGLFIGGTLFAAALAFASVLLMFQSLPLGAF